MTACSVCEHSAHVGVCVACLTEYEADARRRADVCVRHREDVQPCNVCGTTDVPTWLAGGVWWCDGCATWQTQHSAGLDDDGEVQQ